MRRKQRQFTVDALEPRDLKSDSGLPDACINWDGDISKVPPEIRTLPPGYTQIGDVDPIILKPIDAGFQGTVDTFYWLYNQITKDWWSSPSSGAK